MNKDIAKVNYDYMIEQLKNNPNLTRKQKSNYREATKNLKWFFGF